MITSCHTVEELSTDDNQLPELNYMLISCEDPALWSVSALHLPGFHPGLTTYLWREQELYSTRVAKNQSN